MESSKKNVFENAKRGDCFKCHNGSTAVFMGFDSGMAMLLNCHDIPEGWIGPYELDGTADCGEEYDIVS